MANLEAHYSAGDIEARILAAIRAAGLNPEQRLSPEELGTLDHFHTGGFSASLELLELAQIRAEDRVLACHSGQIPVLANTLEWIRGHPLASLPHEDFLPAQG